MKVLSFLFSLLLGAAVLLFFVQPWDRIESMLGSLVGWDAGPTKPKPASVDSTAAVETAPATPAVPSKPVEAPDPPPSAAPAERAEAGDPRTTLLANEKAEAERSAALQRRAAVPVPRETKRYFKVTVRDSATLEAGPANDRIVIRLEGIAARSPDETCKTEGGKTWPCGAKARAALVQLIRARAVTCTLPPGGETKDFAASCNVMGQDLSTWLVRRGWAAPQAGSGPELAKALEAAKTERLGLWQAE
jgi:endonuclease YncB( thermonuclease family)